MTGRRSEGARAVALAGLNGAGKTSLLDAVLFAAGAVPRQGSPADGTSVGDASPEARGRGQSTELNVAGFEHDGDRYVLLDTPGSVEFAGDGACALAAADLVLIVTDPDPQKAALVQPILKEVERLGVPRALFVNKIDTARGPVRELLAALQAVSPFPLVARQIPIWTDEHVTGFVDLALERAYLYRQGQPSERVDIPAELVERETESRFHMLEQLADHDDALLEQLLEDVKPADDLVFADLTREMRDGLIAPVFFGSAQNGHGVRRLMKALRHETPEPAAAAARLGADGPSAFVLKTSYASQAGKQSVARVLGGDLPDGAELTRPDGAKERASGLHALRGAAQTKVAKAGVGDVVAVGKLEGARTGELLSADGKARTARFNRGEAGHAYALAIRTRDRKDDVRLSGALQKLVEEDPALAVTHEAEGRQVLLHGRGEAHLATTLQRLKRRFGVEVETDRPATAYREGIRKSASERGKHKKQTGGHGQFGDVVIEVKPLKGGEGFRFNDRIVGGVVPRQWIPAVEAGVRDAMERGPLGFPVVDVEVTLVDGSYPSVDSSELAFRTAGRLAMSQALAKCDGFLLEPVEKLTIHAPSGATPRITSMISGRRGQILGFDAREGWPGWDRIEVYLPHSERQDVILELRSLTQGMGSFEAEFHHMAPVTGRAAEEARARAAAA